MLLDRGCLSDNMQAMRDQRGFQFCHLADQSLDAVAAIVRPVLVGQIEFHRLGVDRLGQLHPRVGFVRTKPAPAVE